MSLDVFVWSAHWYPLLMVYRTQPLLFSFNPLDRVQRPGDGDDGTQQQRPPWKKGRRHGRHIRERPFSTSSSPALYDRQALLLLTPMGAARQSFEREKWTNRRGIGEGLLPRIYGAGDGPHVGAETPPRGIRALVTGTEEQVSPPPPHLLAYPRSLCAPPDKC